MPDGQFGPIDTHELIRQLFTQFNDIIEKQRKYLDRTLTILTIAEKALLLAEKAPSQLLGLSKEAKSSEIKRYVQFCRQEIIRLQKIIRVCQKTMEMLGHQDPEKAIKLLDDFIEDFKGKAMAAKSSATRTVSQAEADAVQALSDLLQLISSAFKGQAA